MAISILRQLCLIFAVVVSLMTAAVAQEGKLNSAGQPDYSQWERVASRAESVLGSERASTDAFEVLRRDLSEWRAIFVTGQSANAGRIETLNAQIAALGAVPADGQTEPEEIAARRSELNELLAQARVPVLRAEEAFTRADGLVDEIDALVRERQSDRTIKLDPSPVNPVNWPSASRAVFGIGDAVSKEFATNSASAVRVQSLKDNLPLTLLALVVGLVLVTRSGAWIDRGLMRLRNRAEETRASVRVGAFFASALGFVLPLMGLIILVQAPLQSEFLGPVSSKLFELLAILLAAVFGARWLGREVFPKGYPPVPVVSLAKPHMVEGRTYTTAIGALVGFDIVGVAISGEQMIASDWSDAVVPVLRFPVLALAGLMLFRLGQLMVSANEVYSVDDAGVSAAEEGEEIPSRTVITFLGRAAMFIGIAGPVLVAIGYVTAGGALITSFALTLGLFGVVAILQRLIRDLFEVFLGADAVRSALVPVLISFALIVAALPFLALIWGARVADLLDIWGYISSGFNIGDTRISLADFATFLVIFFLGYGVTRLVQGALATQVLPKTSLDTGGRNAVVAGTGYVGIFLAAILAITGAGIDLSSLAIVAGALSVGIGFGLQTIVSNFVSGIILLIERPISEGDWIEVGSTMGVVKKIAVRATTIETFDRTEVIVPNADLIAGAVTNWTKENLHGRLIMPVGVAYGTDTKRVEAILREIAEAHPMVIVMPPPAVLFMNFGADALEFEIRAILRDVNYVMSARSEINHEIARRFAEEGIEVPFAQRDLWLRNPEVLGAKT